MTYILQANPSELIQKTAEELKKQNLIKPPQWSIFVKTATSKQRLPDDNEWWYIRAAAILRSVAKLGPVGTQKLRTRYGSNKRRGHQPSEFRRASGSVIRKVLQQLETAGLVNTTEKSGHKGRVLTAKGTSFLDKIAIDISKKQ